MSHSLWSYLRQCHICGEYKFKPTQLLCSHCKTLLYEQSQCTSKQLFINLDFPAYTWCSWSSENDKLIRPVVYAIKSGYLKESIYEICEQVAYNLNDIFKSKPVLLPAPAEDINKPDHAYQIALSLSKIYNLKVLRVFERTHPNSFQKTKSKEQRCKPNLKLRTNFSKEENNLLIHSTVPLLFVDDLITTGSTAKHAYNALKNNHRYSAFSLFYRTLSHYDK